MKAFNRLLQLLALGGAIASGAFYFLAQENRISSDAQLETLQAQLSSERSKSATLRDEVSDLRAELDRSSEEAERLDSENLLAETQLAQLQRENQRLVDERDVQAIAEQRLQSENDRLTQELATLRASSVPRDRVVDYEQQIAALERQILELQQTRADAAPQSPLLSVRIPENPSLAGKVLTVGKEASFVVLDIGYNEGVRLQSELYVQHGDTPIAKIQVTEVKENLSIARVLPESLLKTPQSGDSVASPN
ncbi:hypothetical protein [Pelagicoccus sp. SDUM812003]|uniref:hypothetical protein n=1 Tax=Pelagicoccus sp. SDUM812003 TaxID=3041267 RepID=UPI0028100D9A|nr:hypothetical protein [Pelagicoccus sp. SDUM812003]MDQ8203689.1 hypothetical protein [Pelagicoccus sp. SDUM812003]